MKSDIILAGVGGQGILSIAAVIGFAALNRKFNLKQSEVHGMSQRGGDVQSNLRISDEEIFSDLIPKGTADVIISVEPMESLRYMPWLSDSGWLVTNSKAFENIPDYPDIDLIYKEIKKIPNHIIIDADSIASEMKSRKSSNMVVLGAAIPYLPMEWTDFETGIRMLFGRKGEEIVQMNINALKAGLKHSKT